MKVAVVGGGGYVGGELLRLLFGHPEVEVVQVTSDALAGRAIGRAHPNLRRVTSLVFDRHESLRPADATFLATPHGSSMEKVPPLLDTGGIVVDLSADYRLRDPTNYPRYYGTEHPHPELLADAVYGLPELYRERLRAARIIAVPGCVATAAILALRPLLATGRVDAEHVTVDAKSGSSAAGRDAGPAALHPERSGVMRPYAPVGHRHTAEIEQETGFRVALSAHAVEAVRGVLATCQAYLTAPVDTKELWRAYRGAYQDEPFVRVVHETDGIHREPEPKILAGTNYCDVGFATDEHARRVVAIGALDNLVKGAAGNAVQSFNLRAGFPEAAGLGFVGLHPI